MLVQTTGHTWAGQLEGSRGPSCRGRRLLPPAGSSVPVMTAPGSTVTGTMAERLRAS